MHITRLAVVWATYSTRFTVVASNTSLTTHAGHGTVGADAVVATSLTLVTIVTRLAGTGAVLVAEATGRTNLNS